MDAALKLGVNTWVWTSPLTLTELGRLAPFVRTLGFNWIEIPLENVSDLDPVAAKEVITAHGLGVSVCAAMGPDRDLIHEDAALRENGAAYIRAAIDFTQTVGATTLAGPMYSAVGRTWQQTAAEREADLAVLVPTLRSLASYAADRGVVLCIEPLNRFETSFLNLASQAIDLIDRIDHPGCQIMLDTFHMNIEEKSAADAIRAVGPRLRHLHACENDRGAPGTGSVAWPSIAQALRDIHYEHAIVIESFTSAVKSIARAAAIWRSLAPSQDELARQGGSFLRELLTERS